MRGLSKETLRRAAGLGFVFVTAALAYVGYAPPRAQPASAPADAFSAGRARAHLQRIAAEPHAIGTAAHARVRDYLVTTLRELGLAVEVEERTVVRGATVARVKNVVARLAGSAGGGPALLVATHYDSVPSGPGAGDDGAAVAAVLETARALRAGPALRNDVVFLISDGEEIGLMGARGFDVAGARVGAVIDFEARGARGPSLMFETGRENGWLVRQLARVPHPMGSSLYVEVYRRMPNDTDFTALVTNRRDGPGGLNFAFIDGFLHYHTALDDVAHVSMDSLQHHGETMLALARLLGDAADLTRREPDRVFFDLLGVVLVHYPASAALPLALLACLALGVVIVVGVRRQLVRVPGVLIGAAGALGGVPVAALVAWLAWQALRATREGYRLPQPHAYGDRLILLGVVALALAAVAALALAAARRVRPVEALAGALLPWALLAVVSAVAMPGGSYLFVWPLLAGAAGVALLAGERTALLAPVTAVPALLILVPIVVGVHVALTLMLVPAVGALVALGAPFAHLPRTRHAPIVLAAVGFAALVGSAATTRLDAERRRADSLAYLLDSDSGRAFVASSDARPDEWTRQVLGSSPRRERLLDYLPDHGISYLVADAPVLAAAVVPRIEAAPGRAIRITSAPGVTRLQVAVHGDGPISFELDGQRVASSFVLWAPPEALVLRVVGGAGPVHVRVDAVSFALPAELLPPRPRHLMPMPFGFGLTDLTLVRASRDISW